MSSELITIGAVIAIFGLSWRMYSHHDTKTGQQISELAKAISNLKAEVSDLKAAVAAVGAKVDILLTDRR